MQHAGGFHLAHNAAALLTGVDGAIVLAAFHIAGLAAGNTADIIANVAVANGSAVDAGAQHTGIVARNAACIGHIVGLFGFQQIVQGQVIQLDFVLAHGGIHAGRIGAVGSHAVILAHNAAHKVAAVHCAAYRAAVDTALDRIDTGNAANLAGAGYHAVKRAIFNRTGVTARNAAHAGAGAARLDAALYRHIAHQGPLLHIAKQALHAAVLAEGKSGNGVVLAFPCAAKAGDTIKVNAGKVNIGFQHNGAVLAPTVQAAVLGQLDQVIRTGKVDRIFWGRILHGFGLGGVGFLGKHLGGQHGPQHTQADTHREEFFQRAFCCIAFHQTSSPSV